MTSFLNVLAVTAQDLNNLITFSTANLTLEELVAIIINIILYLAGVLALIFLIYDGILYITSGGNADQAKKAQQGLINAIIGIIIIVLSLVIIRSINSFANVLAP